MPLRMEAPLGQLGGRCRGDVAGQQVLPRRGLIVTVAATLPLAFVMIAGAQIISSFFSLPQRWKADSAAYVLGAGASILGVVTIAYFVAKGIKTGDDHSGSQSQTIDYVIVGLLLVLTVVVFHGRKKDRTSEVDGQAGRPRLPGSASLSGSSYWASLPAISSARSSSAPTSQITVIPGGTRFRRPPDRSPPRPARPARLGPGPTSGDTAARSKVRDWIDQSLSKCASARSFW